MYYRGQRLLPSPHNPIRYTEGDFAIFERTEDNDKIAITVVQKRFKVEPASWWMDAANPGQCQRQCLALYRSRVQVHEVLAILNELAPLIKWSQVQLDTSNAPRSLNPYKFQGFFHGKVQDLELDPDWVNGIDGAELKAQLYDLVQVIVANLCQE